MKRFAAVLIAVGAMAVFASESNAQCYRGGGYRGVGVYSAPIYRTSVTYARPVYGYAGYSPSYSVYRRVNYSVPVHRNFYGHPNFNRFHPGVHPGFNRGGFYYGNRGGFGINIRF